ncbi:halocin C8-like domain-containing protein [Natrinema caseinilyticum]|uniref:halocin C8-like domain-containing protein n=1 Tax=Natrinema caseinilyticum TaxID=2961570 RepID=UPI003CCDD468
MSLRRDESENSSIDAEHRLAVYDAVDDGSSSDRLSTQSTESDLTKRVVTPEKEIRETMESVENRRGSGQVTIQGVGNGPRDECKWAVPLICQNVCGAAGGFACGFFGIISGGIGGVGCLTIVNVTCAFASTYGCTGSLADSVCEEEVNLC